MFTSDNPGLLSMKSWSGGFQVTQVVGIQSSWRESGWGEMEEALLPRKSKLRVR